MPKRANHPGAPERPAGPSRASRPPVSAVSQGAPPLDVPTLVRQLTTLIAHLTSALESKQRYDSLLDDHIDLEDRYEDLKQEIENLRQAHHDLETSYKDACSMLIVERRKQTHQAQTEEASYAL